jgi:hypothetical protein
VEQSGFELETPTSPFHRKIRFPEDLYASATRFRYFVIDSPQCPPTQILPKTLGEIVSGGSQGQFCDVAPDPVEILLSHSH